MVKIFLNPGHGGKDPGGVGNGLYEKDINLIITNKMIKMLRNNYDNVSVNASRQSDITVKNSQSVALANQWGADYFLSIHVNATVGGYGYEDYIYNGNVSKETERVRNVIHKHVSQLFSTEGFRNRGKKKANFEVLRTTKMPAMLSENLFIDSKKDADWLNKDANLTKIAKAHVDGLVEAFNLKKQINNKPVTGKLYKVQTGAFSKKDNAEELARKLQKDGYDTFIVHE